MIKTKKKAHFRVTLSLIIILFSLQIKALPRDDFSEALIAYNYKQYRKALKILNKLEKQIPYIPGSPENLLKANIYYLKSCILQKQIKKNREKILDEAVQYINFALIKNPRSLTFREKYVDLISEKYPLQSQVFDFFEGLCSSDQGHHKNMNNFYKAIYFYNKGEKAKTQNREAIYMEALRFSKIAINEKEFEEIYILYLKIFISFYESFFEKNMDHNDYDLFLKALRKLSSSFSEDSLLIQGKAYRFLNVYSLAIKNFDLVSEKLVKNDEYFVERYNLAQEKDRLHYLIDGIKFNPFNQTFWELLYRFMDTSFNYFEFERYRKDILDLIVSLKEKGQKNINYLRICKGIIYVYDEDYKKAEKKLKNFKHFKLHNEAILDEYFLRIYINLDNIDQAIEILKKRYIKTEVVLESITGLDYCKLWGEAAIIACREDEISYIYLMKKVEKECPRLYSSLKHDIKRIEAIKYKKLKERVNKFERGVSFNSQKIYFSEVKFDNYVKTFGERLSELTIKINDIDNKVDQRYNELIQKIETRHEETLRNIDKLRDDLIDLIRIIAEGLDKKIEKNQQLILKTKAELLKEILENRDNISEVRTKLRSRLSDYINFSVGIYAGPVGIGVNILRIFEDIFRVYS